MFNKVGGDPGRGEEEVGESVQHLIISMPAQGSEPSSPSLGQGHPE